MSDTANTKDAPAGAITHHVANGVGYITLALPERLNVLDDRMVLALRAAFRTLDGDKAVKVVVIRGAGRAFSAGGDMKHFVDYGERTDEAVDAILPTLHEFLCEMESSDKMVVCSVHGFAAGGGMSLAFAGDFCIAEEGTSFVAAYGAIGLTPDAGGSAALVRAVGVRNAMRLLLGEDRFDTQTALQTGLVTKIAPKGMLEETTAQFAERLANMSQLALVETRTLLRQAAGAPLGEQLERERVQLKRCMQSPTFRGHIGRLAAAARQKDAAT